jgi:hypothetical protein
VASVLSFCGRSVAFRSIPLRVRTNKGFRSIPLLVRTVKGATGRSAYSSNLVGFKQYGRIGGLGLLMNLMAVIVVFRILMSHIGSK